MVSHLFLSKGNKIKNYHSLYSNHLRGFIQILPFNRAKFL